jgi:RimJ/RimL family protein N-acetyltransferase/predicted nucleic acid-binding protein
MRLETTRLYLEPWDERWRDEYVRIHLLPESTEHQRDRPLTPEEAHARFDWYAEHWRDHGFGPRIAVEKESGRCVGVIGLRVVSDSGGAEPGEVEVGWVLDPAVWGRGYATEGAAAMLDFALGEAGLDHVIARTAARNAASVRRRRDPRPGLRPRLILDTSGLFAFLDRAAPQHEATAAVVDAEAGPFLLSPFVLAELDYLLGSRVHVDAELALLDDVARGVYHLVGFTAADVTQAREVVARYADLHVGLADASLVVLAGRHETNRMLTLDERRFRAMRTPSGQPFVILPADA